MDEKDEKSWPFVWNEALSHICIFFFTGTDRALWRWHHKCLERHRINGSQGLCRFSPFSVASKEPLWLVAMRQLPTAGFLSKMYNRRHWRSLLENCWFHSLNRCGWGSAHCHFKVKLVMFVDFEKTKQKNEKKKKQPEEQWHQVVALN